MYTQCHIVKLTHKMAWNDIVVNIAAADEVSLEHALMHHDEQQQVVLQD